MRKKYAYLFALLVLVVAAVAAFLAGVLIPARENADRDIWLAKALLILLSLLLTYPAGTLLKLFLKENIEDQMKQIQSKMTALRNSIKK